MRLTLLYPSLFLLAVTIACSPTHQPTTPVSEAPVKTSTQESTAPPPAETPRKTCKGVNEHVVQHIQTLSENISKDSVPYNSGPLSDCSGIFHRVLDSLRQRCPDQVLPPKQYRSSRDLARWYHEKGALTRIEDALAQGNQINEGMVLFYGPRKSKLETDDVEALFRTGGINHVGVVTEVQTNAAGTVISYYLFHGLRPGKVASITKWHKREYRNRPQYPPYGNGTEQWVAMAPILID